MEKRNIVVVGASAGGLDAIRALISGLPIDSDVIVLIVWHMGPGVSGVIPRLINKNGNRRVANAVDGEPLEPGRIYVAPPDRHLIVERGRVRVTKGPKQNRFRPAIDPLFRSAAIFYGPRVIGVILSGSLDDGSAGLWAVKNFGGIAIVQDPSEAEVPAMPENAMNATNVDYSLKVAEMGGLIDRLSKEYVDERSPKSNPKASQIMQETESVMGHALSSFSLFHEGRPSSLTCPDCHGALTSFIEGKRLMFRCHTGHTFSSTLLLDGIELEIDEYLWNALRASQEASMLLNNLGDHFAEDNDLKTAAIYFNRARETERRIAIILSALHFHESALSEISGLHTEKNDAAGSH